jgi:lipopolysaccharide transport system permease protein/teichoic acid transport system permease protein
MIRSFARFLTDLYQNKALIMQMARWDFKSRYLGSYLGLLWAFIQPTVTIMIFWFVFEVGFKSAPVENIPFILWLITGMIPWFFFSDSLMNATTAVVDNSFLVKKIVFRVSMLPIVKILTSLVVHLFFIAVIFAIFFAYGIFPSLHSLQVLYYLFATIILLLGLSWITSSVVVFSKDIGQLVSMFLQFGFWLTPIFWSINIIPQNYHTVIKLNPIYYITEGYRDAFIHQVWFWERPWQTVSFWGITGLIFMAGAIIFSFLRPHFADVL